MTKQKIQEALDRNAALQAKLEGLLKEVSGNLAKVKKANKNKK